MKNQKKGNVTGRQKVSALFEDLEGRASPLSSTSMLVMHQSSVTLRDQIAMRQRGVRSAERLDSAPS